MSGKHEETALINRLDSGSMAGMTAIATDKKAGDSRQRHSGMTLFNKAGEPQDVGVDGFGADVGVENFGYDG